MEVASAKLEDTGAVSANRIPVRIRRTAQEIRYIHGPCSGSWMPTPLATLARQTLAASGCFCQKSRRSSSKNRKWHEGRRVAVDHAVICGAAGDRSLDRLKSAQQRGQSNASQNAQNCVLGLSSSSTQRRQDAPKLPVHSGGQRSGPAGQPIRYASRGGEFSFDM
jgi:hypothetical protein